MSSPVKIAIGVVVLGALLAGGVVAATKSKKAIQVRIEPVERRDLVASVTASGAVVPRVKVDVSTDISGRIINLTTPINDILITNKFSSNTKSYWIRTAWPTTNLLNSVVGRA